MRPASGFTAHFRGGVLAEQPPFAGVAPQDPPRLVARSLGDVAFGHAIDRCLGGRARTHAMPRDVRRVHSSARRGVLQSRADRIAVKSRRRDVAVPINHAEGRAAGDLGCGKLRRRELA